MRWGCSAHPGPSHDFTNSPHLVHIAPLYIFFLKKMFVIFFRSFRGSRTNKQKHRKTYKLANIGTLLLLASLFDKIKFHVAADFNRFCLKIRANLRTFCYCTIPLAPYKIILLSFVSNLKFESISINRSASNTKYNVIFL